MKDKTNSAEGHEGQQDGENIPQSIKSKRYSVCLVFTNLLGNGKVDIMLRNQINYANSESEALGLAINYFNGESHSYSLTCKCAVELSDPLQSQITQLESDKAQLQADLQKAREGLEKIIEVDEIDYCSDALRRMQIAEQTLKETETPKP